MSIKKSPYKASRVKLHSREQFSVVKHDPDVKCFVLQCLKTMTFKEAAAACLEKFGKERAPSKSAIHRYWKKNKLEIQAQWKQEETGSVSMERK